MLTPTALAALARLAVGLPAFAGRIPPAERVGRSRHRIIADARRDALATLAARGYTVPGPRAPTVTARGAAALARYAAFAVSERASFEARFGMTTAAADERYNSTPNATKRRAARLRAAARRGPLRALLAAHVEN